MEEIERLRKALALAEKERDAAVFDLGHAAFVPQICKHYDICELVDSDGDRGCLGAGNCADYEWRGICRDNARDFMKQRMITR